MPIVTTSSHKRPRRSAALPLIALVVLVVVAAAWLLLREGPASSGPASPDAGPAEAATSAPDYPDAAAPSDEPSSEPPDVVAAAPAAPAAAPATNAYVKRPGQMMLPGGQVITFKPPAPGEKRRVFAMNKIYECDSEGNWEDVTPKKLFDNPVENHVEQLALENRSFIPAFMTGFDTNEVMKALQRDVVIDEGDPPDIVARKEAVAEMKGVILDYIAGGGTYDGFIHEMAAYVKAERKIKGRAISKIAQLVKAGDIEGAKAYLDECNGVLEQQEYTKLQLPRHILEAMGGQEGKE